MDAYKVARFVVRLYAGLCLICAAGSFVLYIACLLIFRSLSDPLQGIVVGPMSYALSFGAVSLASSISLSLFNRQIAAFAAKAWSNPPSI